MGASPEHRAEGLPAPAVEAAPARLHRHPQELPLEAAALGGGSTPGPLPSEGWASFPTGTGLLRRAFQGLLRANLGTWNFTPSSIPAVRCVLGDPGEGNRLPLGGK